MHIKLITFWIIYCNSLCSLTTELWFECTKLFLGIHQGSLHHRLVLSAAFHGWKKYWHITKSPWNENWSEKTSSPLQTNKMLIFYQYQLVECDLWNNYMLLPIFIFIFCWYLTFLNHYTRLQSEFYFMNYCWESQTNCFNLDHKKWWLPFTACWLYLVPSCNTP